MEQNNQYFNCVCLIHSEKYDENDWFNEENNDNVDGDKNELFGDNDNDLFGVVKPAIDESDRFLGRIPGKKSRIKIFANDQGDEVMEEPENGIQFQRRQNNCVEKHQKIKGIKCSLNLE